MTRRKTAKKSTLRTEAERIAEVIMLELFTREPDLVPGRVVAISRDDVEVIVWSPAALADRIADILEREATS